MFCRAALLLPLIGAALRFRGYNKTERWLQGKLNRHAIPPIDKKHIPVQLEMTCRMVRAAEYYSLARASCLEESLLLWYLLRCEGISAAVRIGVRKNAGKFEAHAWVERDGIALNQLDEAHRHYAAFDNSLPKPPMEQP